MIDAYVNSKCENKLLRIQLNSEEISQNYYYNISIIKQ